MKEAKLNNRPAAATLNRQAGITLIELLVVMVIISLFATIVGQRLFRNVDRAMQVTAKAQISEFESVIGLFRLDVGRFPNSQEGLQALRVQPSGVPNWDGPYLAKEVPLDPWGVPYQYRYPGTHNDYDLLSFGADGQEGGADEDLDIVSWQ